MISWGGIFYSCIRQRGLRGIQYGDIRPALSYNRVEGMGICRYAASAVLVVVVGGGKILSKN